MVCTIDLLPGATLKKVKSILEQKAMEKYIAKALKQKFISPSTVLPLPLLASIARKMEA